MSIRAYIAVFALLVGSTAGELGLIGVQGLSRELIVTSLIALASVKAVLVALFFQELKDEPRPLGIMLLVGIVILMGLLTVSFIQLHPVHV